jgi:hypothetical protein
MNNTQKLSCHGVFVPDRPAPDEGGSWYRVLTRHGQSTFQLLTHVILNNNGPWVGQTGLAYRPHCWEWIRRTGLRSYITTVFNLLLEFQDEKFECPGNRGDLKGL